MKSMAVEKRLNGLLMTGHDADLRFTFSSRLSAPSLVSIWPHVRTADRSAPPPPTVMAFSSIFSIPVGSQKRPRIADDSPALSLGCLFPSASIFSHHNGANVQPCGQLTAKLWALCKLYDGETIVCFAHRGNAVAFRCALMVTLIYDELLMINRLGDCIQCSPVG